MTTSDTAPAEQDSPLHQAHTESGAVFTDFAGWRMPVRYSSDIAEHHAVRTSAGLFDLSHMGEILVIGPQAARALDYALSGNLSALAVNQAKYTLLLTEAGGVIDDLVVYRTGDDRYMVVANASNRSVVVEELVARTAAFDAEVYDESDDLALLAVQGPASLSIVLATPGFDLPSDTVADSFAQVLSDLRYYWSFTAQWKDSAVLIARTGYTGEDGFEIYVAPEKALELWRQLLRAGAEQGIVPAGLASRDTLRLEAGMPLYGHELTRDTAPAAAGLGRVIDMRKPDDFIGRAAAVGAPDPAARVLVGLRGQGKRAAREGYPVVVASPDGAAEQVGVVTSGALSPTLGYPIAMAYVAPEFSAPETALAVDVRGSLLDFTVTPLPFYRRKKN